METEQQGGEQQQQLASRPADVLGLTPSFMDDVANAVRLGSVLELRVGSRTTLPLPIWCTRVALSSNHSGESRAGRRVLRRGV